MSGHSKWSTIKHKKGATDAKRGKIFTRLIKEITVAARMGGGDPDGNPRLRSAIASAKTENMPKDNIVRAIKKGTGELEGAIYDEILYEGYGPGGVAVLVECMTDNRNRTVADVRHFFAKNNGNLGASGCVAWMFDKKGLLQVEKEGLTEEQLMDMALEAGAEDVVEDDDEFQVITAPESFDAVRDALEANKVRFIEAAITMIPQNNIEVTDEKIAISLLKLLESLEDHDDVQNVHANFDIADDLMEKLL
ncbi:MAG: YebC/PmpR family DNA-binding transcriptional regulator [Proteobacteria bacterium]|jgi:YebC/PmpR family DNA-binding regulatory protein|nr:YebC/PmpR family DNA-binding transcriptional regulator [Desulfocapsa sp.]MBU3945308.1 YebC/PmpR family DNA-binding transcriptional regulator [Pseudomonadota bacterium]MBU3983443.1 YebC/PmpR family DNA-binding transcriptional regulator [Pseudomonadota bacterium]MBU4028648.1 YebC/PmpR family DNA-binding transcriptional regulator [Pseudomonadota bacterium]MBU4044378.1 YebC/PmpR family DNA-binding transcriptional regulator [Pseudomonadota bacterium]